VKCSLLGVSHSVSPAHSTGEAWILALYGVASAIYRTALCAGIIWLISGKWLLLGLVMAAGCVIFWLLMPLQRASAFLLHSPQLARCRPRALSVSFGLAAVIVATLCLVPVPAHFRAPGVLQAERFTEVIADAPGIIAEPPVKSGTPVRKGQLLARLKNPELTLQLAAAQAEYAETIARKERALDQAAAELKPLQLQIDAVAKEVTRLHDAIAALDIKAPHDGIWFAPHLDQADGQWLLRGQSAGMVIAPGAWNFRAVIPQNESRSLFDHPPRRAEVRLPGAAGEPLAVSTLDILPAQQQILPSPALGWRGGGSIAVTTDADGLHAAEPFFEARATLAAADPALLQHGRTGFIRFSLPPSPVAVQLWRRLGQLFQQRGILE
jgi:putative peptide zinc metalloprotease protein